MSFGGRSRDGGEVAIAVTFGGRRGGRDDPWGAWCLVLLRHSEEGRKGRKGWQHQARTKTKKEGC